MSTKPTQAWTAARAREALCFLAGHADERPILLRDHDNKFGDHFDTVLRDNGVRVQKVGPLAPNLNAIAERWVQTVQHECLDNFVVFGEVHLRYLLDEFIAHYHFERPHQGLGNQLLSGADPPQAALLSREVECQERLGGLLKHYRRRAA
jgi:putative transposase